jgi:hypothetical protein
MMAQRCIWRGVLIVVLSVALATPARADSLKTAGEEIVVAVVAVTAAIAVVVTVLVIHYSKKRTITGCVNSGGSGLTVTDERDRQIYSLAGNTVGITAGDRMKLKGEKVKSKGSDRTLVWETQGVTQDFGVCHL